MYGRAPTLAGNFGHPPLPIIASSNETGPRGSSPRGPIGFGGQVPCGPLAASYCVMMARSIHRAFSWKVMRAVSMSEVTRSPASSAFTPALRIVRTAVS